MKTMKNFLSMAALALMGAMMTGCSSDDNFDNPQQPEYKSNIVTLTTTVSFDTSAGTRALTNTGVKTFAVNDQIAVIYKNTSNETVTATSNALTTDDITNEGKNANFTVTLTNPKASEAVRYIYPAAMLATSVATDAAVNADANVKYGALATQDGTLTNLASKLDLAIFDGSLTSEAALPASASMTNKLAILAITLKDNAATPSEITGGITDMTISDGTNTYTVSRSAAAGPIYVAIRPVASANIKIYASDGSKYYNKNLTKTYKEGNGYSVSWKMPEALISNATTADYGMAVCAAGHLHTAKTAVPAGCTAVGILGKVTETGHGLILALQDATSQTWNTINGWTSVTTYAGTTLQVLPDDAARGSLASYTALGETTVSNWAVAQKSDYEAIFENLGSTAGDSDGKGYDDNNVNLFITTGVGGSELSGDYWSATNDPNLPWVFGNYWFHNPGSRSNGVRPVLGFTTSPFVYPIPAAKAAAEATAEDLGKVIGTDGNIYADVDAATAAGTTAVAMIAYVGSETGVAGYTHGLALALTDEASTMNWTTATGASGAAAHTPAAPTPTTSSWMLPSKDQWNNMIDACKNVLGTQNNYQDLRDGFSSVGGSNLQSDESARYWSSTVFDSSQAWRIYFYNGIWNFDYKDESRYVRACLAF